jgi:hypothetical protein
VSLDYLIVATADAGLLEGRDSRGGLGDGSGKTVLDCCTHLSVLHTQCLRLGMVLSSTRRPRVIRLLQ